MKYECDTCDDAFTTQNKQKDHVKTSSWYSSLQEGDDWSPGGFVAFGVVTCRKEKIGAQPYGVAFGVPTCRKEGIVTQLGGVGASDVTTCRKMGVGAQHGLEPLMFQPTGRGQLSPLTQTLTYMLILTHTYS